MNTSRIFNRVLIAAMIVFVGSVGAMKNEKNNKEVVPFYPAVGKRAMQAARICMPIVLDVLVPSSKYPILKCVSPLVGAFAATCFNPRTECFPKYNEHGQVTHYNTVVSKHSQDAYCVSQMITRAAAIIFAARTRCNQGNFGGVCDSYLWSGVSDFLQRTAPFFVGYIHDFIAQFLSNIKQLKAFFTPSTQSKKSN